MRVLVVAGPSGGHIFPALGFLGALKDKYKSIETLLVLPKKRSIASRIQTYNCKVDYISISAIKLSLGFENLVAVLNFFKGSLESIFILLVFKPDIVIGFGSLTCIPMIIFSWLFRIKTLIHEQNLIPGRANRFLRRFTDRIAVSFMQTKDYFKDCQEKITFTGSPIRKELIPLERNKALRFFGFDDDKFTILVMGGSLGSRSINTGFLKTISAVSDKRKLQIIHLAGFGDYDLLKDEYKNLNISIRLFEFLEAMQYAYSASDLVVSRAGATTITEIIFFKLPAIIIPYPYAYQHQASNAEILERIGSAIIIQDHQLNTDILRKTIDSLINNSDRIKMMRSSYDKVSRPDANDLLVEIALSLN